MRESTSLRRIGSLASTAGVSIDTLRYYEREGLLPPATRTAGGFRLYTQEMAQRLQFIKQARLLGLTLGEIRGLLEPDNGCCAVMRAVIAERLADVDRRLAELSAFRATLQTALERCDQTPSRAEQAACPGVQQLRATEPPGL